MQSENRPIALLIENDSVLAATLQEMLETAGFCVFRAHDSSSAQEYIKGRQDWDLIILDLFLSNEPDGWEFLNVCDDNVSKDSARVIFSGHPNEKIRARKSKWLFIEKGAAGFEQLRDFVQKAYISAQKLPPRDLELSRKIIRCTCPKSWKNVYVLGCFDKRVTLYSQQVRALTLIRALYETGQLDEKTSVAIVGAGVAGVTAAIGAALLGSKITLFDSASAPFHLQEGATHRFVHPHVYLWPSTESMVPDAGLPFLNWSANRASEVVQELKRDFRKYVEGLSKKFTWKPRTLISTLERVSNKILVKSQDTAYAKNFDLVILAIGYGVESEPSYWNHDRLDGPFSRDPVKILISGAGDGGLIDLARATIRTGDDQNIFHHDQAIDRLSHIPGFIELAESMETIDKEARMAELSDKRVNLTARYKTLRISRTLINEMRNLKRKETEVVWHYRSEEPFNLKASLINRLLALLLTRARLVTYRFGHIAERSLGIGDERLVTFTLPNGSSTEMKFDLVVKRYGPPKDYFQNRFPDLYGACATLKAHAELELTGGRIDTETLRFWKVVKWKSGIT